MLSITLLGGLRHVTLKVKPRQAIEVSMDTGTFYTMSGRNITLYGSGAKIGKWMCEYYERTEDGF